MFFLAVFVFSPFVKINSASSLSDEERVVLIEQLKLLIKKINDFRWQLQKTDLQKEINAVSHLVIDVENNSVLLSKNAQISRPIASVTKLMTAVIALENADPSQKITLSQDMFLTNSYQRPSPAIYVGTTVAINDLVKASLIQSTNNAAESLSYFLTKDKFIKLMNDKSNSLGMKDTYFYDAHGLSSLNQSSAFDIAKLIVYIAKHHPEILEMTTEEKFQLPGNCPEHNWICTFKNLNTFHGIASFMGGKTGYTRAAGNTFAGIFEFNDMPYIIVLLNTPSRTIDTQKIAKWLEKRP